MKLALAIIALVLLGARAQEQVYSEDSAEGESTSAYAESHVSTEQTSDEPDTVDESYVENTVEGTAEGTVEHAVPEEVPEEPVATEEHVATEEYVPSEEHVATEEPAVEQDSAPDRGAVPCFYWDGECTSSYGVDFPGNDIAIVRTGTTSDCCAQCKSTEGCLHWVARGTGDGGYVCHLKSVYGFPTYCDECTFSYTKSDACKSFCETTCHKLNLFGPAVCGTDGYTYESPCQMTCTGVSLAADGECDSPYRISEPHNY